VLWEKRRGCERGFDDGDLLYGAGKPVSLLWQSCMFLCVARGEVCMSSMERRARSSCTDGGNMVTWTWG